MGLKITLILFLFTATIIGVSNITNPWIDKTPEQIEEIIDSISLTLPTVV